MKYGDVVDSGEVKEYFKRLRASGKAGALE